MPMSDEAASAALSAAQRSMEITAEIIKVIAPAIPKLFKGALDVTKSVEDLVSEKALAHTDGNISHEKLLATANKIGCSTLSTDNFPAADIPAITVKAKESGIPITIIGNGDNRSIEFLERDKIILKQIMQEVMADRLKQAPQNVKSFTVSQSNIAAIKEQFDKGGVECQFAQSASGKIYCMYPAAETEKVATIKQEIKSIQSGIADNFKAERKNGVAVMEDTKLGKSISFVNEQNKPLTKAHVMEVMEEQFSYTKSQAEMAANKLCDDLKLDKKTFIAHNEQLDNINAFKTNIKFDSDSILLKGNTFSAVNFKGGTGTHIFITNGNKGAALSPSSMTETEMKNICITSLSMSEQQADETVKKSLKIDSQINSKLKETTIFRDGGTQTVNINRTSHSSFSVMVGKTKRMYDFNDKDIAAKMCKDLGITEGKAQNIINKAKKQGTIGNKVHDGLKKATDTIKPKISEIGNIGKGARR